MDESIKEKIESGNYIVVPKWTEYVKWVSVTGIFVLVFQIGAWSKENRVLQFDSKQQKDEVISTTKDVNIHLSRERAEQLFVSKDVYSADMGYIKKALEKIEKEVSK